MIQIRKHAGIDLCCIFSWWFSYVINFSYHVDFTHKCVIAAEARERNRKSPSSSDFSLSMCQMRLKKYTQPEKGWSASSKWRINYLSTYLSIQFSWHKSWKKSVLLEHLLRFRCPLETKTKPDIYIRMLTRIQ